MSVELLSQVPVMRLGRARAQHRVRVLIEDDRVIVRTGCGLDPTIDGFVETFGFPTCGDCDGT